MEYEGSEGHVNAERSRLLLDDISVLLEEHRSPESASEIRCDLERVRRVRAWVDSVETKLCAALRSSPSVVPVIELEKSGLRSSDVRRVMARADAVTSAPEFATALEAGVVTAAHVDGLAGALRLLGDRADTLMEHTPSLVHDATIMSPDEFSRHVRREARRLLDDGGVANFERQRRSTYLRTWVDDEGMTVMHGKFDPERGTALVSVLDRVVEEMFHSGDRTGHGFEPAPGIEANDHRRALALVDLLCSSGRETPIDSVSMRPARAEIVVHIGLETLVGATTGLARVIGGSELPVETVRRLACEADLIPIVLNGAGVALDVGRSKRLATAHQRRALAARYETCAIPTCAVLFHRCEPHHLRPWEDGGRTDLANLLPLCVKHHHAVHEGGWKLDVDPTTGDVRVTYP
jgi:hypothetical protein